MRISPGQSVGQRLRRTRADRGLGLDEVSEATRIDRPFLEALERDAPPEAFPEPMYARAFLREYARHLGMRSEPLVSEYRAAHPEAGRVPVGTRQPVERRQGGWLRWALAAVSIAALVGLAVVSARDRGRPALGTDPAQPAPVPAVPAPAAEGPGAQAPAGDQGNDPGAPVDRLEVAVRVVDAPCWVRVVRDGRLVLEGTQEPGFSRTFRAGETLELTLGNAGATRLTVSGERLGAPAAPGEVYRAAFVLEDDEVRTEPLSG